MTRPECETPDAERGAGGPKSELTSGDTDTISPQGDETPDGPYIAPWPPSACTDATAAPHVGIRELDRRRYWHNRLEAHLGRRAA